MYSRNLILAASLAVLTLSAPTPSASIVQREEALTEHKHGFSLIGLVRDVLRRDAWVEPIPDASYEIAIEQRSEDIEADDEGEVDTDIIESSEDLEDLEERGLTKGRGGSRRGLTKGSGPSRRGLTKGNGPSRRGLTKGRGGSKRGLTKGRGGSKRGLTKGRGGSKRGLTKGRGGSKRYMSLFGNEESNRDATQ